MKKGKGNHPNYQEQARLKRQRERQIKAAFSKSKLKRQYGDSSWKEAWFRFETQLNLLGLTIKDVAGDGNCLFRAIADQLWGDPTRHAECRQRIVDYVKDHREEYECFIEDDEPFDSYVNRMYKGGSWGGHIEIHACSHTYHVNVTIHQLDQPRWELITWSESNVRMIHLSYHDGDHYASVRLRSEPSSHTGPPLPINLPKGTIINSSANDISDEKRKHRERALREMTEEEELVASATSCWNIEFIRAVIEQCGFDTEAAIDFIVTSGGAEDEAFQNEFVSSVTSNGSKSEHQQSQTKQKNKKSSAAAAATSQSKNSDTKPSVHPKLQKFQQNQHISNKERQRLQKEEKEREKQYSRKADKSSDTNELTLPQEDAALMAAAMSTLQI